MAYILLAEDDTNLAKIFSRWLENAGHEIEMVENGLDGMRNTILNRIPDLLITDIMMPGLDGESLSVSFDVLAPGKPVVVVTASSDQELLKRVEEGENVKSVLKKPIDCNTLLATVSKALE